MKLLFAYSLGYAFHVGAQLKGEVSLLYDRIEDAIVQADEVDGHMLQFEGGLSITGSLSFLFSKNIFYAVFKYFQFCPQNFYIKILFYNY